MGRRAALEENGYKEGTKEYEYTCSKIVELERILWKLYYKVTKVRIKKLYSILEELNDEGLNFDIGASCGINSKVLLEFLEILDLDNCNLIIKQMMKESLSCIEIQPVSYGYGRITIEELKDKYL